MSKILYGSQIPPPPSKFSPPGRFYYQLIKKIAAAPNKIKKKKNSPKLGTKRYFPLGNGAVKRQENTPRKIPRIYYSVYLKA